jgi:hypothetical protein
MRNGLAIVINHSSTFGLRLNVRASADRATGSRHDKVLYRSWLRLSGCQAAIHYFTSRLHFGAPKYVAAVSSASH